MKTLTSFIIFTLNDSPTPQEYEKEKTVEITFSFHLKKINRKKKFKKKKQKLCCTNISPPTCKLM